ncbi:MAG: hypothetical protein EXR45_04420 [Chloroflexi bacterium]|nr:hypothetical protein [Chloroflexota bacterium]
METNYDLVLKGGHVIDPANGIDAVLDVAVKDGRIAAVGAHLDASHAETAVDVAGLNVSPGLIDIHVHVYPHFNRPEGVPGWDASVIADAHSFRAGVTTFVDAGCAGAEHFQDFRRRFVETSKTRVLAFINIANGGMGPREQDPYDFNVDACAHAVREHSDVVVGVKTAHYWTQLPWDDVHTPWESVDAAVAAGDKSDTPVMVDFWPRPPLRGYDSLLLEHMRPGDIHTHVFAQQFPIVGNDGKVLDHMWKARERGVLFDLGHGGGSFWFRNAVPALRDGFMVDSISTDLHMGSVNAAVLNSLWTASKCFAMGMSLHDVIRTCTVGPAKAIRRPDLGTLSVGSEADIAVLRVLPGKFSYTDCGRARFDGEGKLECALTVRAGKVVWDPTGMSMPLWENAPAPYWRVPALQG